jgi:D-aminoacyl-tRNA deacylase
MIGRGLCSRVIALVQRVSSAKCVVGGVVSGEIGVGLVVFVGIEAGDGVELGAVLVGKVLAMRVFADEAGKMNLSVRDVEGGGGGGVLWIPNFTLAADVRKGTRPSFAGAMRPEEARGRFEGIVEMSRSQWGRTAAGVFGGDMKIEVWNDGPVSLVLRLG